MSRVLPLIGFGVGFLCLGFYWHIYNDVFTMFIQKYVLTSFTAWGVVYTSDKFYEFMYMVWRILPWLCVFIGVLLLLSAGASSSSVSSGKEVSE